MAGQIRPQRSLRRALTRPALYGWLANAALICGASCVYFGWLLAADLCATATVVCLLLTVVVSGAR
jgi:hypothetical protein